MPPGRLGIARVGVLTIIEEEFEAAQRTLELDRHLGGSPYYADASPASDVVLARAADRTNVAATMAADQFIEFFRPEVLIVLGIAGGISGRGVELGDVVAADYLHYAEFRKLTGRGDLARYIAYDQPVGCTNSIFPVTTPIQLVGCTNPIVSLGAVLEFDRQGAR